MSIINAYERALERHELEKTAQAYIDTYGTADGYLPKAYMGAYIQMEKEAHAEAMVTMFAPETGYIPAQYVSVLEKEAGFLSTVGQGMKNTARGLMGKVNPNAIRMDANVLSAGAQGPVRPFKVLNNNATLGDMGKYYGAKALGVMANNPGTTLAAGGLGVAGTGYALTR